MMPVKEFPDNYWRKDSVKDSVRLKMQMLDQSNDSAFENKNSSFNNSQGWLQFNNSKQYSKKKSKKSKYK